MPLCVGKRRIDRQISQPEPPSAQAVLPPHQRHVRSFTAERYVAAPRRTSTRIALAPIAFGARLPRAASCGSGCSDATTMAMLSTVLRALQVPTRGGHAPDQPRHPGRRGTIETGADRVDSTSRCDTVTTICLLEDVRQAGSACRNRPCLTRAVCPARMCKGTRTL
jgi:hypothetical protein